MKVLVVSDLSSHAIANSFIRAMKKMGHEVIGFDPYQATGRYIRLKKFGQVLHRFLPVEAWTRKGNRELAVFFQKENPDKVMVFGNAPVLFGVLAFMKSISKAELILFWPDTLINLGQDQLNGSRLYDTLATYSKTSIPVFNKIGYENVKWVPFAGDEEFLGSSSGNNDEFLYDVSFAGGWRPERERALSQILNAFPSCKISVAGTEWARSCTDKRILENFQQKPLYGKDFGNFLRQSRINLNVIDDTNYPAANMRFFEVPAAGGLQLSSSCPEQSGIFKDGETILYFKDSESLVRQVGFVLENPDKASQIRKRGNELIKSAHTYIHRLNELFSNP